MSVKIQYASDLHLEVHPTKFRKLIKPCADILILAGDIGHPFRRVFSEFLKWCSQKFEHVVFVPGNHEYHGSSLSKARRKMQRICRDHGVLFADRDILELPEYNLVILGATLWSNIPPSKSFEVSFTVDDYSCIEGFNVSTVNKLHRTDKNWLRQTISFFRELNPEYRLCVVTHHAPTLRLPIPPKHRSSSNESCAHASDCSDLMDGVWLWIYGHTHYNNTFRYGSTIVTSNQRGYSNKTTYHKDQFVLKK